MPRVWLGACKHPGAGIGSAADEIDNVVWTLARRLGFEVRKVIFCVGSIGMAMGWSWKIGFVGGRCGDVDGRFGVVGWIFVDGDGWRWMS